MRPINNAACVYLVLLIIAVVIYAFACVPIVQRMRRNIWGYVDAEIHYDLFIGMFVL